MSEITEGGTEVLVNIQKMLTCREKVGGSQRTPLLTKKERTIMDITKKLPKNRVITMLQYKDHVTDDSLTRVSIYIDHVNPKHRMDTMSNWIEFDIKKTDGFHQVVEGSL